MGLLEDLEMERVDERCKTGRALDELPDNLRAGVEAKMALPEQLKSTQSIAVALLKNDVDAGNPDTVREHRRRQCRCFRGTD